jgi:hypothetical protein
MTKELAETLYICVDEMIGGAVLWPQYLLDSIRCLDDILVRQEKRRPRYQCR